MLQDLHVRNLAIIDEAAVEFGPGLNVLSGETGAGKSIVVDALSLLAGARAATDLIRRGTDKLTVTGRFRLDDSGSTDWREALAAAGVESDEDELVVRREITREGRNRVFLNDRPVTLRLLTETAAPALRIHAQREELVILAPERQRRLLDRSAGSVAVDLLAQVRTAYQEYEMLAERWDRMSGDQRLRQERIDLLQFQAGEIDAAQIVEGEEAGLREERQVLRHSEAIVSGLGNALVLLFEGENSAGDQLAQAVRALAAIGEWEPSAAAWSADLDEARIRAEELASELRSRLGQVGSDPQRQDEVEARLAQLDRLSRKYGGSTAEVMTWRQQLGAELDDLIAGDDKRDELEGLLAAALERYRDAALELSRARRRWTADLVEAVHGELVDLAMGRARFDVTIEPRGRSGSAFEIEGRGIEFGPDGFDQVTFLLAANPGESMGPLAKVASGGELSRVYLALRLASRAGGGGPTLVFDEVDAGIGGAEAAALGRKLRSLSEGNQVLAVTHLAQVASCGHLHFKVSKAIGKKRTVIQVDRLDNKARVEEVARMLAGDRVTDLSRSHAEELLTGAG